MSLERVKLVCNWLVKECFVLPTLSDELFIPAEIDIKYETFYQICNFVERRGRAVGVTMDEICEHMKRKYFLQKKKSEVNN